MSRKKRTTSISVDAAILTAAQALAEADDRPFSVWLERQLAAIIALQAQGVDLQDVVRDLVAEKGNLRVAEDPEKWED